MRPVYFIFLASLFSSAPLHAQNIVLNGTFDESLIGWYTSSDTDMTADWSPVDAGASGTSGSVRIVNISAGASNGVTLNQCVPINSGQRYTYGGKVRIPSGTGQVLTNNAVMSLRYYSEPDCSGPLGGSISTGNSPQTFDTWVTQSSTVTARSGARSAEVRALVSKFPAGGSFMVRFDDITLTTPSIFANGFD